MSPAVVCTYYVEVHVDHHVHILHVVVVPSYMVCTVSDKSSYPITSFSALVMLHTVLYFFFLLR